MVSACAPSVEPGPVSDNTVPPSPPFVPGRAVLEIRVEPPPDTGAFQWEPETVGLVTMLLETGLADLRDVVPIVEGAPPAIAFDGRVGVAASRWTARLELGRDPAALAMRLHLCDAEASCTRLEALGTREDPTEAVADLVSQVAGHLRLRTDPRVRERQSRPLSQDRYAVLVCGRAAATWYGRLPPVPSEQVGDRGRDPFERAVYLDPGMHLAWWVVARQAEQEGRHAEALEAVDRALVGEPDRIPYLAERAALLQRTGDAEEALATWTDVSNRQRRGDLRFRVARARSALEADRAQMARDLVTNLAAPFSDDPGVVRLLADIADAQGRSDDEIALLARWQALDPADPEPVHRRVIRLLDRGRRRDAWDLLPVLDARGRREEAAALQVPLGIDVGAFDQAAEAARALGRPEIATRIEARRDLAANPSAQVPMLASAADVAGVLARGEARLARGEPDGALEDARLLLEVDPWLPEALSLEARAETALGNVEGEGSALDRLALADPEGAYLLATGRQRPAGGATAEGLSGVGPSTAPGSTGSPKQAQSSGP